MFFNVHFVDIDTERGEIQNRKSNRTVIAAHHFKQFYVQEKTDTIYKRHTEMSLACKSSPSLKSWFIILIRICNLISLNFKEILCPVKREMTKFEVNRAKQNNLTHHSFEFHCHEKYIFLCPEEYRAKGTIDFWLYFITTKQK